MIPGIQHASNYALEGEHLALTPRVRIIQEYVANSPFKYIYYSAFQSRR